MIWAIVENEKREPTPNMKGVCPACKEKIFSKCGDIYVWHWSHFKDKNCDKWQEGETIWHKSWKMTFGKNNTEICIQKNGKRHIADVLTNKNVVIELQNSPIKKSIIREREEFYGEQMLWLINGEEFINNLTAKDYWEDEDYRELMSLPQPPVRWVRKSPEISKGTNDEFFKWKYPRRSWEEVQRPVFIDFGDDSVFWVKEGMGTTQIRGTYISKKKFIEKYEGNYKYYCQQKPKQY